MTSAATVFQILCIFIFIFLPALVAKQAWLALMFLGFILVFAVVEVLAIKLSGMSISQHFWALKQTNFKEAVFVAVCMAIGWGFLIYHFLAK